MQRSSTNLPLSINIILRLACAAVFVNLSFYVGTAQIGQSSNSHPQHATAPVFKSITVQHPKKFWRAAAEWSLMQALPWASNRFIRNAQFARISFKSIAHNLNPKTQEFDDNKFFNNQFSHPYQGSLYFNSFRANGYNFWQSVPAAFSGTLFWELAAETHTAAPNDIINTSLGGIVLGEMSARLSVAILRIRNEKKCHRTSKAASFILSPIHTANHLFDNNWNTPDAEDSIPITVTAAAGSRVAAEKRKYAFNKTKQSFGRLAIRYGDPFTASKIPFNSFSMVTEFGNDDSSETNLLQVEGCLYGKSIGRCKTADRLINVTMNYDFLQNASFSFGAQSIRINTLNRVKLNDNIFLEAKAGAGLIVLAAVPNTYMYYGEGRNYDYCSGLSVQAGAEVDIAQRIHYTFDFNGGDALTINGSKSSHLFYHTNSTLRLSVFRGLSVSVSRSHYFFRGNYRDLPQITNNHYFSHLAVSYTMNL